VIVYSTRGGVTKKVAERIAQHIGTTKLLNLKLCDQAAVTISAQYLVLMSPTYGDEELEESFEKMLLGYDWSQLKGVPFAFCEIGIYTGYEDFGHGLIPIVYETLGQHGLRELVPPLSLDSVPLADYELIDRWAETLASRLNDEGLGHC
jgi:flavodoxin